MKTLSKKIGIIILCVWLPKTFLLGCNINDSLAVKTVLFKITGPNTQNISWLFGTHHAFGKTFFDTLTFANKALSSSGLLIKENLNNPGQLAEDIINKRTTETKWRNFLSKTDLEYVNSIFTSSKVDLNKMTPTELFAFLNRYYKGRFCLGKDTSDHYFSLDDYIGSVAKGMDIELVGLETTEDQIDLINKDVEGMPIRIHRKRLTMLIGKIRSGGAIDCGETDWYRKMDIDYKLEQACQNSLILIDRNNRWMEQLMDILPYNSCFIAVGLSHLMFDCGLINQLQGTGYTITPVELN